MPNNKSKKSRRGKRRARNAPSIPTSILPKNQTVTLSYTQTRYLTEAGAGVGAFQSFRFNDLFDPDFTGVGAQPVGFDQLSAMYSRFRVLKTTVTATVAGTGNGAVVTLYPSAQSTLPANFSAHPSQPYARSGITQTGSPPVVLRVGRSIWDVFGIRKTEYMSDMDFTCTAAASPTRSCFLHVSILGFSGTAQSATIFLNFNFQVELSEPVALSLS